MYNVQWTVYISFSLLGRLKRERMSVVSLRRKWSRLLLTHRTYTIHNNNPRRPVPPAQSLNVSVASAVVLGIARSQGAFKADMSTEEITQLYTQWLGRTAMQVRKERQTNNGREIIRKLRTMRVKCVLE